MIRPININLNAAHPELPLVEATTFTGAPSSVFIRGVPKAVGNWSITAVSVAVTYPDNTTTARAAVESAEGVWVATIPGTATTGRTAAGFKIMADGIDENGAAVTGYVLGFADFSVLSFTPVPAPGGTFYLLRYFDQAPATPKEGDVAKIDGVLKFYNGSAWEPFAAPATLDDAVTRTSANGVKSSGIWSALWGALSALPTGFSSLYDWVVAQIAKLRDKLDLAVYGFGNATVALPDGFSITFYDQTYTAPVGGETITFIGPVPSSNQFVPNYRFYYPSTLGTLDSFDPNDYSVWCLVCLSGGDTPDQLMYKTGPSYSISGWNSAAPTLTLSNGEATGDAPTMARPLGATGDTLAKVSQIPALVAPSTSASDSGKAADAKATGDALDGKLVNSQTTPDGLATLSFIAVNDEPRLRMTGAAGEYIDITFSALRFQIPGYQEFVLSLPMASGLLALTAGTGHAGNLAALDAQGNPTDAGWTAGDLARYALVTKTISNGAVSLDDRASNAVTVSATLSPNTLTINFPTAPTGKLRDFSMRLNIAAGVTAPEIAWPQGVTLENNGGEVPEIADGGTGGSSTILYFSETENNGTTAKFLVKGETLTAIAQA